MPKQLKTYNSNLSVEVGVNLPLCRYF